MSQNTKNALKSFNELKETKVKMDEDTILEAITSLEELPEVGMMAQIAALKEQAEATEKRKAAITRKFEAKKLEISDAQASLMQMETSFKSELLNLPQIAEFREEWGEFFNKKVGELLEKAKASDASYQKAKAKLNDGLKAAKELQKELTVIEKNGKSIESEHSQLSAQLKSLVEV